MFKIINQAKLVDTDSTDSSLKYAYLNDSVLNRNLLSVLNLRDDVKLVPSFRSNRKSLGDEVSVRELNENNKNYDALRSTHALLGLSQIENLKIPVLKKRTSRENNTNICKNLLI